MLVKPEDLGIGNARIFSGFIVANQIIGPPIGAFLFAVGMAWPFGDASHLRGTRRRS